MARIASIAAFAAAVAFSALAGASGSAAQVVLRSGFSFHIMACAGPAFGGMARCHAHIVSDIKGHPLRMVERAGRAQPAARISGGPYWASQLRAAYGITGGGSPTTVVAIVDAYGYPNAASDVATYRSYNNLPALAACASLPSATPCLRIVNETGGASLPQSNAGWDEEQALDLDMV